MGPQYVTISSQPHPNRDLIWSLLEFYIVIIWMTLTRWRIEYHIFCVDIRVKAEDGFICYDQALQKVIVVVHLCEPVTKSEPSSWISWFKLLPFYHYVWMKLQITMDDSKKKRLRQI